MFKNTYKTCIKLPDKHRSDLISPLLFCSLSDFGHSLEKPVAINSKLHRRLTYTKSILTNTLIISRKYGQVSKILSILKPKITMRLEVDNEIVTDNTEKDNA